MITKETLNAVKSDTMRLATRITELENALEEVQDQDLNWVPSRFTAALKRASMDLSKSLARLRARRD